MISEYIKMRRKAMILPDTGGYDRHMAEMNPVIFEEFISEIFDRDLPMAVWEPFASHTNTRTLDCAESKNIEIVAFDLSPIDKRIEKKDATKNGPIIEVGGVLFHPPYFGSAPQSEDTHDLSRIKSKEEYLAALGKVVNISTFFLKEGGLACVVGSSYLHKGKKVDLNAWFLELFERHMFELVGVWSSEPDTVLLMRYKGG